MIFHSLTNYPDVSNINHYLLYGATGKYSSVRLSLIKKMVSKTQKEYLKYHPKSQINLIIVVIKRGISR